MVDLVVLCEGKYDIEPAFGKNEEPDIPYHCVKRDGQGYQILFLGFDAFTEFKSLEEARKYALLESQILWDPAGKAKSALQGIESIAREEQREMAASCKGYIGYLLGDYKQDRWARREAWPRPKTAAFTTPTPSPSSRQTTLNSWNPFCEGTSFPIPITA